MRRQFLKYALATALLAASATTGALAQQTSAEKPPIKIGALFPMSGIAQAYGEIWKIAVDLSAADINADGGINGSPLQFDIADDQLNPQQSVLLYRDFVGKDVVAVLGPISGTSWQNVAPLANSMGLLAINVAGVQPGVSVKPWAIRTHPADDTMIPEGVAEFVKAFPDAKSVVVTGDGREASGAAGMAEYKKAAEAHGLTVLDMIEFETTTKDFSPVGIRIRGLQPDAVFVSALGPVALALLKELEVQAFEKPVLLSPLAWAGPLVNVMGSAGKNVYTIGYHTIEPGGGEAHDAFVERLTEASKSVPLIQQPANVGSATVTYDTIQILARIMQEEGIDGTLPVDEIRKKIVEATSKLEGFQGLSSYTMRDTGDAHIQVHLLKADGDHWVYALPADQRTK